MGLVDEDIERAFEFGHRISRRILKMKLYDQNETIRVVSCITSFKPRARMGHGYSGSVPEYQGLAFLQEMMPAMARV